MKTQIYLNPAVPMPTPEMMFMPGDKDNLVTNGLALLDLAAKRGFYVPSSIVIDIGCGYGRLAYAMLAGGFHGVYIGMDILDGHISWLNRNLKPHLPARSSFIHIDASSGRYRPKVGTPADQVSFPPVDVVPDLVTMLSVFTHLYPIEVEHYIKEVSGLMGPKTMLYATFFLRNQESIANEKAGKSAFPMPYRLNEYTSYFNEQDPLWAISFDEFWIDSLLKKYGLEATEKVYGSWCGRANADSYQDSLFIRKIQ